MKRSTTRWTTAFAAAALLGLPAAGWSQAPATPSSSPTTAQQPPASSDHAQHGSAQDHLRQAKAALNDVPAASIPARAKTKIAELKRHLNALEESAGAGATASKTTARSKSSWATEVAAIDKILTELLGPATTSGASEPVGTTGTTGTRASEKVTLDDATSTKLMEVRKHVTAFASAMSGTGAAAPSASEPSTEAAAAPSAQPPAASGAQSPASSQGSTQPPAGSSPTAEPPQSSSASPAGETTPQQSPAVEQADPQEAKKHLTAARDSLSQLTQLPAAAQLTGEPRTQVSQLISNFNELITTNAEWRASYTKVEANITALLGSESADPAPAQAPAPTATPGAVGTSGSSPVSLDPAIRAKLLEFRAHLAQFEKASSGGSAGTPGATGTTGSTGTAGSTGTTGSMGSMTNPPASTPGTMTGSNTTGSPEQSASTTPRSEASGQDSALHHIEAIEAMVSGRAPASGSTPAGQTGASSTTGSTPAGGGATTPTGTTGTSAASTASGITLDRTQVEQIKMHLAELRKAIDKKQ